MFDWLRGHLGAQQARTAPLTHGFALGWVLSDDARQILLDERYAAELREAGARMVRVDFRLGRHPAWDDTILGQYERVLDTLARAGVEPLGLIGHGALPNPQQAQWTANNSEVAGGGGDNPFIASYVATARALTARFHDRVRVWELWNEPNVWTQQQRQGSVTAYSGGSWIYPSNYAALLARAYAAIKGEAGLRDLTLVFGGLLAHNNGGAATSDNSGAPYLQQVYEAGLHGLADWDGMRQSLGGYPCDAVGQHLYLDQTGLCPPDHIRAYVGWLHQAVERYEGGGSAKPLYVTETAWSTTEVSPEVQAANLTTLFAACAEAPYVAACLWFELQDNPFAHLYFGVADQHGAHKPSFGAFQQAAASQS